MVSSRERDVVRCNECGKITSASVTLSGVVALNSVAIFGIIIIATDKALFFIRKMLISFLFVHENKRSGYSLEVPG